MPPKGSTDHRSFSTGTTSIWLSRRMGFFFPFPFKVERRLPRPGEGSKPWQGILSPSKIVLKNLAPSISFPGGLTV
jgi:hypothetical protein